MRRHFLGPPESRQKFSAQSVCVCLRKFIRLCVTFVDNLSHTQRQQGEEVGVRKRAEGAEAKENMTQGNLA